MTAIPNPTSVSQDLFISDSGNNKIKVCQAFAGTALTAQ